MLLIRLARPAGWVLLLGLMLGVTLLPVDTLFAAPSVTEQMTTPALAVNEEVQIVQVSAGNGHSCALTATGYVLCWGYNGSGELGDGTTMHRAAPAFVVGLSGKATLIDAGAGYTCALVESGEVQCWHGYNPTPTTVAGLSSGIIALSSGAGFACALTAEGGVQCWGDNGSGQLGNGSEERHHAEAVAVVGLGSDVTAITTSAFYTCALTEAGAVYCWGLNEPYGMLGDGTITMRRTPVPVIGLNSGVTAITAGTQHTCALLQDGSTKCWGENREGQLGDGTTNSSSTPVSGIYGKFRTLQAGGQHNCGITLAGRVECWGDNFSGQLGNGTTDEGISWETHPPVAVVGLAGDVTQISVGHNHNCVLTAAGIVQCWGANYHGQLGHGATDAYTTPVNVAELSSGVVSIAAGGAFSCALTETGVVYCWGGNYAGQLGDGTRQPRWTPLPVAGIDHSVASIAVGEFSVCALSEEGDVTCWGDRNLSSDTSVPPPQAVEGLPDGIVAVANGDTHRCVLTEARAVHCWGSNENGQLGDGTTTSAITPTAVVGLSSNVRAIAAGERHSCALTMAGSVKCWGSNEYEVISNGDFYTTPVTVAGLGSNVDAISARGRNTCALTSTGGVRCWGSNLFGQLGDGNAGHGVYSRTPVAVVGLSSGITAIDSSAASACARNAAGSLLCWGLRGGLNHLGDANANRTPVEEVSSGFASFATGNRHTCLLTPEGGVQCYGQNSLGELSVNPGWTPLEVHFPTPEVAFDTDIQSSLTPAQDEDEVEGSVVNYDAIVRNNGNVSLSGVEFAMVVPAGTEFSAAQGQVHASAPLASQAWDCADGAPEGTKCTYTIGSLAAEAIVTISFAVRVVDDIAVNEIRLYATTQAVDLSGAPLDPVEQVEAGIDRFLHLPAVQR